MLTTHQHNRKAKCTNYKDFTELQFSQSIEINVLGPNQWISHDWNTDMLVTDNLKKK
jgi:hypothetical protein